MLHSRSPWSRYSLLAPLLATLGSSASAQRITPLVMVGDTTPSGHTVTYVLDVDVNDAGHWIARVDTDAEVGLSPTVLINGSVFVEHGQAVSAPAGATIDVPDPFLRIDNSGHVFQSTTLDGTDPPANNRALYWDSHLLVQTGDAHFAPGLNTSQPFSNIFKEDTNDAGEALVNASFGYPFNALMVIGTDGAGGLMSESVVMQTGDPIGSGGYPATGFPPGAAINDSGSVIHLARWSAGGGTADSAIYLNNTLLAEEGGAAPLAGRVWGNLQLSTVDLSDAGDYVIGGPLDNGDGLYVLNGQVYRQVGGPVPGFSGESLSLLPTGGG